MNRSIGGRGPDISIDRHQLVPQAVHACIQAITENLGTYLFRERYHIELLLFIEENLQVRVLRSQGICHPRGLEIVIHREI